MQLPLYYGMFFSVAVTSYVSWRAGFSYGELFQMMWNGIRECYSIFVIIMLMGSLISLWMSSGMVPTMIYYGFGYLKQVNYVLASFLISALVSFIMGTALGTVSTVGMALLGIGKGLMIPPPLLLGSIISGAFVADKLSPMAGLVNLTLNTTKTNYKDYAKSNLITFIPTLLLTISIYYFLGSSYTAQINADILAMYQKNIQTHFYVTPYFLIFPATLIIMAMLGIKIIPNMSFGVLGGVFFSYIFQKLTFLEIGKIVLWGYRAVTEMSELNQVLKGGGILPMVEVILIVAGAVALNSLFEGTEMVMPIFHRIVGNIKTIRQLVFKAGMLSIGLTTITCDQTVGILLPGRFLQNKYEEMGLDRVALARTISDTGTIIAPLIPWNVNAIIAGVITGISAIEYGPYAVLCYIAPIITFMVACLPPAVGKWKHKASIS